MNDIERAIELFENCDTVTFTVTGCGEESYQTIEFENVVEALEKQIARKPVNRCATFLIAECPHCNGTVNFHHKHCHWCGQKLDWEVANESTSV